MKVPLPTTNTTAKSPSICTAADVIPQPASFSYEPKSVLDLGRSPSSPVAKKLPSNHTSSGELFIAADSLQLENHHVLISPHLEDWDSWMTELGSNDNDSPVSRPLIPPENLPPEPQIVQNQYLNLPDFTAGGGSYYSPEFPAVEFGLLSDFTAYGSAAAAAGDLSGEVTTGNLEYVDELIRLAECFETNSVQLGQLILARLNERLRSPVGKALQRAAFYFKEALQSLFSATAHRASGSSEIVQTIKAQKIFAHISPIPMFSSFTANQALLEATDGAAHVHIVDFEIGFGGQWASFMKEIAEMAESRKSPPPVLRISAVVTEEHETESNLVRDNLAQFAGELNIRFDIEFIPLRSFEYLHFKAVKFIEGEKLAVVLSPAVFREIGSGFLTDLRRVSPHVVVHVDMEGQIGYNNTASYRQAVINGLEFYSTLLESIEAANLMGAVNGFDWIRGIETFVLYPKIMEAVGRRGNAAREALVAAGLRPVVLSQFADFQAEYLLRKVQIRGFHVVKRQAEMLLCWHDRPLASMSAWRY